MKSDEIYNLINDLEKEEHNKFEKVFSEKLYLEKLLEVSLKISTTDLSVILKLIIDNIIKITAAKRGFLLLLDKNEELDYKNAVTNVDIKEQVDYFRISESIAHTVVKSGTGKLIHNIAKDIDFKDKQSVIELQLTAIICVPLKLMDRVIGIIYIDSDSLFNKFSKESMQMLEAFAAQAALAVENARLIHKLKKENIFLKKEIQGAYQFGDIICQSKKMKNILQLLNHVLDNSITVLIQGETGTGKELIARAIHYNSIRKNERFVAINCSCMSESLLESELFGFKKGSFTGAGSDKTGLFEAAHGGTIFLDEIGETSPTFQAKLLRVLETQTVRPVGATNDHPIDVRVIAATNRNLNEEIKENRFREDLFYRLNAFPIFLPPLRERKEDIPILINHFVNIYNKELNKHVTHISNDFIEYLSNKEWKGNIRELKNFIYRMMVLTSTSNLDLQNTVFEHEYPPSDEGKPVTGITKYKTLAQVEKEHIQYVLDSLEGNQTQAAKHLGLNRGTLIFRMKKLEIKK